MNNLAKSEYEGLKASGDLKTLFPRMTGNWEKDKTEFIRLHEANLSALLDIDVYLDDEDENYFENY
jgi:hypothetical protein